MINNHKITFCDRLEMFNQLEPLNNISKSILSKESVFHFSASLFLLFSQSKLIEENCELT